MSQIKKTIQEAFDEASVGYDEPSMRFFDISAKNLAARLPLKGHEHILDAATGTGKIAFAIASRLKDGHVTGIDLSPNMVAIARRKKAHFALNNVSFGENDVDHINFNEDSFDGLTSGFGVHFWPDMEKTLRRLLGFVKMNGFVAITSFSKGSFEPHANLCLKQFARFGVKLPSSYSIERLDHPDKNIALLKNIGLSTVSSYEDQAGYYLTAASEWWNLVLYTGYRAFLNQLNPIEAARFKTEFIEAVNKTRTRDGIFLNVRVITTIGYKK